MRPAVTRHVLNSSSTSVSLYVTLDAELNDKGICVLPLTHRATENRPVGGTSHKGVVVLRSCFGNAGRQTVQLWMF